MGIGNAIKEFFRAVISAIVFFYEDTKSDFKFIKDVLTGKKTLTAKFDKQDLSELKDWKGIIKDHWFFFLIVVMAFFCGMFFAANQYQDKCNIYILETFYEADCSSGECLIDAEPLAQGWNFSNLNIKMPEGQGGG